MIKRLLQTEPTRLIGHTITALLAILTLLSQFGLILDEGQRDAISNAAQSILLLLTFIVAGGTEAIRSNVYSPATTQKLVREAAASRTPRKR